MKTRITSLGALALVAAIASACSGSQSSTISPIVTSSTTSSSGSTTYTGLAFALSTTTLSEGQTISLAATGGYAPYYYCIVVNGGCTNYAANQGTVNDTNVYNASYTAPSNTGSVTLMVTDSYGEYAETTLTISYGSSGSTSSGGGSNSTAVAISPSAGTYVVGQQILLTTTGGSGYYTYSPSPVSQSGNQAIFTAPSSPGGMLVQVSDTNNLTATSTLTIVAVNGLTITPGKATLGTGQTVQFQSFGGSGQYTYATTLGSFSGATYHAPGVPGTATITVTDTSNGQTASTTMTINATYSTSQISSNYQVYMAKYAGITFDNNSSATQPSFEVFGANQNHDGSSVGYDNNDNAVCYGLNSYCAINVALSNFVPGTPATYRGTIEIDATSASEVVSYCIPPSNTSIAYLNQASNSNQFYEQVAFTDSNDNGLNTLFGGALTETYFFNASTAHGVYSQYVYFKGGYTYNSDCSDFSSSNFIQVDN